MGTEKSTGTKVFSVSGHVMRPGNYEIVMRDTTLRELVYDIAGGFRAGRASSRPAWLAAPASTCSAPRPSTPRSTTSRWPQAGSSLGSAGCIVMDDSGCIVRSTLRLAHFYRHESCGKCTPCREGTLWLERILQRIVDGEGRMEDLELIESLAGAHGRRVLCALADTGVLPVVSAVRRFRDDFVRRSRTARRAPSHDGGAVGADYAPVDLAPRSRSSSSSTAAASSAPPGTMLVDAANAHGVEIPVFCYEPRLGAPIGACRMCLVEVEGMRGLQTACTHAGQPRHGRAHQLGRRGDAQDGVLEFLLGNHPLDCPVCDKGGECPLQDRTSASAPGAAASSRPSATSRSRSTCRR